MNKVVIHGRLTRDPELSTYTTSKGEEGTRCNFAVAVDRRFGEETDYFDCVMFGKRGEAIKKFFYKGSEIIVEGEMHRRSYDDKNGVRRVSWQLAASNFEFCGKKSDNAPSSDRSAAEVPEDSFEEIDEDVPF